MRSTSVVFGMINVVDVWTFDCNKADKINGNWNRTTLPSRYPTGVSMSNFFGIWKNPWKDQIAFALSRKVFKHSVLLNSSEKSHEKECRGGAFLLVNVKILPEDCESAQVAADRKLTSANTHKWLFVDCSIMWRGVDTWALSTSLHKRFHQRNYSPYKTAFYEVPVLNTSLTICFSFTMSGLATPKGSHTEFTWLRTSIFVSSFA